MVKTPKIIPVSDLRQKTSDVLKNVASGEPVFITQRGRASAVLVSMQAYEHTQQQIDILRLLALGEKEIEAGVGYKLDDVMQEAEHYLETFKS
jgi:prevent-host-death family protein